MKIGITGLTLAGAALAGGSGIAQTIPKTAPEDLTPAPIIAPTPTATNAALPASEQPIALIPVEPSSAPQAAPRARSTPRVISLPTVPGPQPRPSSSPSAGVTPVPVVAAPAPAPAPTGSPSTPAASPVPVAATPASPRDVGEGLPGWLVPAGLGGLAALAAGFMAWRRRSLPGEDRGTDEPIENISLPAAAPDPPVARSATGAAPPAPEPPQFLERPAPSERAWIDVALPVVHRAGINLVTATADVGLTVRNEGIAIARGVRVAIRLTSAQQGQDTVLAGLYAEPVDRPVVPPFDLAPGEERAVRGIATLRREDIVALEAAGRPMFVPVVALNLLYDAAGGSPGQTTAAFAVGVDRGDGGKLGPMWLDEPARMHEAIAIRAHGTTVKR